MRGAPILSWKSLASVIHPPLPLSSRDSQRLLSLLNTSFTEALDREHPKVSAEGKNTTDQHVHSILSSPIFGPRSPTEATPNDQSTASRRPSRLLTPQTSESQYRGEVKSTPVAHAMVQRSVESLKQHIAAGTADLRHVIAHLRGAGDVLPFADDTRDSLEARGSRSHGMGSLVLSWLWSSGLEYSDKILLNRAFMIAVIPFLALEGRLAQAMHWFQHLCAKAASLHYQLRDSKLNKLHVGVEQSQAMLLNALTSLTMGYGSSPRTHISLEKYVEIFAPGSLLSVWLSMPGWMKREIVKSQRVMLHQMVLCALAPNMNGCFRRGVLVFQQAINASCAIDDPLYEREIIFKRTGSLIVSRIEAGEVKGKIHHSDYDAFSQTVPQWTRTSQLITSILKLHHPTNPDWDHAYRFLMWRVSPSHQMASKEVRRRIVKLGLDVANRLLSESQPTSKSRAKQLMAILQKDFGQELGILQDPTLLKQRRQEADHFTSVETDIALAV